MEKKVRVKRLNHQDDVKRSWTAAYPFTENFESVLPEEMELEQAQPKLDTVENDLPEIQLSGKQQSIDVSAK